MHLPFFKAMAAVIVSGAAAMPADANGPKCFSTWSEADAVARREELVAVEQVSSLALARQQGIEVVKTTLCAEDGRYFYRLILRGPHGHFRTLVVDAKKPFAE